MGLAIAHGIVTSYGGFITCESELGKGTVFRVFFPALEEENVPKVKPVEATPPGKERILFIDDEEILAELGKTMLERLGYEVTVQTSSLNALATFRRHPDRFDVVITDQTMPGVNGMELAKQMLSIQPDIPIILCTGYSTLVNEEQAKAAGIKGFVMKPLSKKMIGHGVFKIKTGEEDSWVCSIGRCEQKADLMIVSAHLELGTSEDVDAHLARVLVDRTLEVREFVIDECVALRL